MKSNVKNNETIERLSVAADTTDPSKLIKVALEIFSSEKVVLASSFSVEDQLLTHLLCALTKEPRIFTLDTGRLFYETYETMQKTMEQYSIHYEVYAPDSQELSSFITLNGPNCFYNSVALRKECCSIRKTRPLATVLNTAELWICGLRQSQSVTREDLKPVEWDDNHSIIKLNPLWNWSEEMVWNFVQKNSIPINPLQKIGYRSIGCAPCTRPCKDDEDIRSGRWWWEAPEHKECGLHNRPKSVSIKGA